MSAARVLRFLLVLALGLVLGLMMWPTAAGGDVGGHREAQIFRSKLIRLEAALRQGMGCVVWISERELNAYLRDLVEQSARGEGAKGRLIGGISVVIDSDTIRVHVVRRWLGWRLTYELDGRVGESNGGPAVSIEAARIGHMPLPKVMARALGRRLAGLFVGLRRERSVFENLRDFRAGPGELRCEIRPK